MNKPMIVSDEYREGYAAFQCGVEINPYNWYGTNKQFWDWEAGYTAAQLDWAELIGEAS